MPCLLTPEDGAIALDVEVDLPRPRHRGAQAFGELEESILARLLGQSLARA